MISPGERPDGPGSRDRWVLLAAAWLAVLVVLGAWLIGTPQTVLREQLTVLQFWSLEATLGAVIVLGGLMLRAIWHTLTRRDLALMAALAVLAVALTLLVAPRTSRIYYDEQIYQGIGQNLSDLHRAQMCNDGTVQYGRLQCRSGEYNKQPYAYPHLLSVAYRLFGAGAGLAFGVNAIVAAATPVVLYLLVMALIADRAAAFFAGLVLALLPQQAMWAATAAVEPSASLACAVALLATAHFCRNGGTSALAAVAVLTGYAVQFRTESLMVTPALGWLLWQHRRSEFGRSRLWWAALLALIVMSVHLGHLYSVRNEDWGSPDARLSLRYVAQNLRVNGAFYLADERFPVVFTLLAVGGLASARIAGARWPLVAYFAGFFGIGLMFYAGSYDYGADVRYSLMTYPPLAVLAGVGVAAAVLRLESVSLPVPARKAVVAVLLAQTLWYVPMMRATGEEAWAARADVRFAADLAPELGGNAYVLTHNPAMFHLWGVNAGQMSLVAGNPSHLEYLLMRYAGGVYLHWNFWCNVHDPAQRDLCGRALALKPVEQLREHRERDQRFAMYRFAQSSESRPGQKGSATGSPSLDPVSSR